MGKKIFITEDLISRLIGYNGGGVRCIDMAERCSDVASIAREIFTLGLPSSKIRDLKDHQRIWAKIIMGCINHRKPTSSPDYINIDQQFLIYFISKKTKVNLPHLLFNHLRTSVKETREDEHTKRDWIPLGRLISDILTENRLIDHLTEAQEISTLEPSVGSNVSHSCQIILDTCFLIKSSGYFLCYGEENCDNRRSYCEASWIQWWWSQMH